MIQIQEAEPYTFLHLKLVAGIASCHRHTTIEATAQLTAFEPVIFATFTTQNIARIVLVRAPGK